MIFNILYGNLSLTITSQMQMHHKALIIYGRNREKVMYVSKKKEIIRKIGTSIKCIYTILKKQLTHVALIMKKEALEEREKILNARGSENIKSLTFLTYVRE